MNVRCLKALVCFLLVATSLIPITQVVTDAQVVAEQRARALTINHDDEPSFTCLVVCMDGRYEPAMVANARTWAKVDCVDVVTEAGPCKYLGKKRTSEEEKAIQKSILRRVVISIQKHGAKEITLGTHKGCAGGDELEHLRVARDWLQEELRKMGIVDIPIRLVWAEGHWKNPKLTGIK